MKEEQLSVVSKRCKVESLIIECRIQYGRQFAYKDGVVAYLVVEKGG